jgi:membrane-bound lytic murein transglycosylase MltF
LLVALVLGAAMPCIAQQAPVAPAPATKPATSPAATRQLSLANKVWTGDFDKLLERRMIRVLVPYSRSLYFSDKGRERGLAANLVREFEQYVNRKYKTGKRPLTVYMIPTTRDNLLDRVASGLGDIAVGNITMTPERQAIVDFAVEPLPKPIKEIVLSGAKGDKLASIDELAGKTVSVRKSSSYYQHLVQLNERFRSEGKPEAALQLMPEALEDEDLLEMANAGVIDYVVVDDWKSIMWTPILPKLKVNLGVNPASGGQIGWAVRKGSPKLAAAIEDFFTNSAVRTATYKYRLAQAIQRTKQMRDPTKSADWKRFQEILALFQRYGERYGFDPLMLAAQGYQESQLDQNAKSQVGAIGVMQLMPDTGAEMKVGDIRVTEANIHAGAKYMDMLMTQYFPDANFTNENRPLFAFASYNAGPGNIARMRAQAEKRGLNPDKWFNNVEVVVAEKIGIETTTYVRNIYKYYATYKLTLDAEAARRSALEQVKKTAT